MPSHPAHQAVAGVGALAARLFYRLETAGERAPADGPLLVVANHPNSLLDPALVTVAVARPARFLAKAPLFVDPKVGWLVRASGAIPVHRRQDGDAPPSGNDDTFRAAEAALVGGDAIALFPEGISHAGAGLAPLKTGAARLALQTAARLGGAFPLVPVGITLDDRAIFRSAGLLVVGAPVAWDDLGAAAAADPGDAAARARVHALTARIADALARVTVSFASWEDARLVALADAVHAAGHDRQGRRVVTLPQTAPPTESRLPARPIGWRVAASGRRCSPARAPAPARGRGRARGGDRARRRPAPARAAARCAAAGPRRPRPAHRRRHGRRLGRAARAPRRPRRPGGRGRRARLGALPRHRVGSRAHARRRCGGRAGDREGARRRARLPRLDARAGRGRRRGARLGGGRGDAAGGAAAAPARARDGRGVAGGMARRAALPRAAPPRRARGRAACAAAGARRAHRRRRRAPRRAPGAPASVPAPPAGVG
jgi:1-acyl-sn-glycerol-3-phosphate acyltransferase